MDTRNWTIGALAKASGLSRSTLLYYDRLGLLRRRKRTAANYRLYYEHEVKRLEQLCVHRKMGIPLKEIRRILEDSGQGAVVEILQRRLQALGREITGLQLQQRQIVQILKQKPLHKEAEVISKERWVEIMRAAGLSEEDMHNWHLQFEKMEPEAHQEFLQSLGIPKAEIESIRRHSLEGTL